MTSTIIAAARYLHVPLASPDGAERISGHSLRATGAQGLTRMGLDPWSVQLLGRWGSEAVRGYIRDAQADGASLRASTLASSSSFMDLEALVALLLPRLRARQAVLPALPVVDEAHKVASEFTADSVGPNVAPELAVELLAAMPPASQDPCWVLNSSSGMLHKVLIGPTHAVERDYSSYCGWRFGRGPYECVSNLAGAHYKVMCARCMPELRFAAKESLGQLVGRAD